MDIRSWTT